MNKNLLVSGHISITTEPGVKVINMANKVISTSVSKLGSKEIIPWSYFSF